MTTMHRILAIAMTAALLSGIAVVAFADGREQARQPQREMPTFSLDRTKAAIDSFFIASVVLKERCREMTDKPSACLAKGEVALLERVRDACEEANGTQEFCGEIADAKRY